MKPLSNAWFAEMRRRLDKAKAINEAYRPKRKEAHQCNQRTK